MDLNDIRLQIDACDEEILRLFVKRMELATDVARYKRQNGLPIFQEQRELQVLKRIAALAPEGLESAATVLFTNIMDISKYVQQQELSTGELPPVVLAGKDGIGVSVACAGVNGAYAEAACELMFDAPAITFCEQFEDVFKSVQNGETAFGIVPIQNSTAGSVIQNYDFLTKYDVHIYKTVSVKIEHCLCAREDVHLEDVTTVYSHEQALRQCKGFFEAHPSLIPAEYYNTAAAGKLVAESSEPIAAICSVESARLYGLHILDENPADNADNYTRFLCIRQDSSIAEDANIISVSLSIPNTPAALYRLLTKFAVAGLNLLRIESKPLGEAGRKFEVIFYLDFTGAISDPHVAKLLGDLSTELSFFKFLGNYPEVRK